MKSFSELSFTEVCAKFSDDRAAREFLEAVRWNGKTTCPHCSNSDESKIWAIAENKKSKVRAGLYKCGECKKQFTVTVGTIFEDSHIPLGKWLLAWHMICCSKKGISALQIKRMLKLGSYRTAHFMMHRIRHALLDPVFDKKLGGTVEVDEAYLGGSPRSSVDQSGKVSYQGKEKMPVIALVERDGQKRTFSARATAQTLEATVEENVSPHSAIVTDKSKRYTFMRRKPQFAHHQIHHEKKQYVLKFSDKFKVHTNTVESSFSLLQRGILGTFHQVSPKYLPLYLAEFDFRWNTSKKTDGERTVLALRKMAGKRLIYGRKRIESENARKENPVKAPRRKYVLRGNHGPGGKDQTGQP